MPTSKRPLVGITHVGVTHHLSGGLRIVGDKRRTVSGDGSPGGIRTRDPLAENQVS